MLPPGADFSPQLLINSTSHISTMRARSSWQPRAAAAAAARDAAYLAHLDALVVEVGRVPGAYKASALSGRGHHCDRGVEAVLIVEQRVEGVAIHEVAWLQPHTHGHADGHRSTMFHMPARAPACLVCTQSDSIMASGSVGTGRVYIARPCTEVLRCRCC